MKTYETEKGTMLNTLTIPAYMLEADEFFRMSESDTDFVEDSVWLGEYETCGVITF